MRLKKKKKEHQLKLLCLKNDKLTRQLRADKYTSGRLYQTFTLIKLNDEAKTNLLLPNQRLAPRQLLITASLLGTLQARVC